MRHVACFRLTVSLAVFASAAASPLSLSASASVRPRQRGLREKPLLQTLTGLRGGGPAVTEVTANAAPDAALPPAHACEVNAYLAREGISPEQGLSEVRASQLLAIHGPNELAVEGAEPLWKLFLAQFDDRLVQILLCVAALSYALAYLEGEANGWVEPAVILGILLLNAIVGVWQESSA